MHVFEEEMKPMCESVMHGATASSEQSFTMAQYHALNTGAGGERIETDPLQLPPWTHGPRD